MEDFKKGHWLKGRDIIDEYENAFHEIGGMLDVLHRHDIEVIPVMYTEATPGGMITAETYDLLLREMMEGLEKALPVDGCLVAPHGAAVCESHHDMDGHWLSLLRNRLGNRIPVVGTLDPHANVSSDMAAATNALISYGTNPHTDQRETGAKAAELLIACLQGKIKLKQHLIKLPMAISIEQQYTAGEPCRSLYAYARSFMKDDIVSISIILGFPYADVKEMGTSFIIISNDQPLKAADIGKQLTAYILSNKEDFVGEKNNIDAVLNKLTTCDKPALLLDMGDNVGGGAPGDSTFLLEKLEEQGLCKSFACIYDPEAVEIAKRYKTGNTFKISIGNKSTGIHRAPYQATVTLIKLTDGKFKEHHPRHGGQVNFDMGQTAIVSTTKGNVMMLISYRIAPFSLQQLLSCGIVPEDFDVLVAKGVNAPIAAYGTVCKTIIQVDTPGVTQADMTKFSYKNRRVPLFPFEKDISVLESRLFENT